MAHGHGHFFWHPLRRLPLPPPRDSHAKPRAQTYSRRQAMLAPATKNVLPSCVHVLLPATTFHSLQTVPQLALPYFCTRIFFCFVIE